MNYRNFMNFTALILFAYAPLRGMEMISQSFPFISDVYNLAMTKFSSSPIPINSTIKDNIKNSGNELELALKSFISAHQELKRANITSISIQQDYSKIPHNKKTTLDDKRKLKDKLTIQENICKQKSKDLNKCKIIAFQRVELFVNALTKGDPNFNKPNGNRKKVLESITKNLIDCNEILKEQEESLISLIQNITKFTTSKIENNNDGNQLLESVIIFENNNPQPVVEQAKPIIYQWSENTQKQIEYINELNLNDNQKAYIFRILWYYNKEILSNRKPFEDQLIKKGLKLEISYKVQKGSEKSLPIFTKEELSLDSIDIDKNLKKIIIKVEQEIAEIQKEHAKLIFKKRESQYLKIKEKITNQTISSETIKILKKYEKIAKAYNKMLFEQPLVEQLESQTTRQDKQRKTQKTINKINAIIQEKLRSKMNPLLREIRDNKRNNTPQNIKTLSAYQNLLTRYIDLLADDQERKEQQTVLDDLIKKIRLLPEERLRKETLKKEIKEKAERERLEKERLEQEAIQKREAQKKIDQQKLEQEKKIQELAEREKLEKEKLELDQIMPQNNIQAIKEENTEKAEQKRLEEEKLELERLEKEAQKLKMNTVKLEEEIVEAKKELEPEQIMPQTTIKETTKTTLPPIAKWPSIVTRPFSALFLIFKNFFASLFSLFW